MIYEIYLNEQIRNVDFESDQMLGFANSVIWAHSESLHDRVPPPEKKNAFSLYGFEPNNKNRIFSDLLTKLKLKTKYIH